MVVTQKPEETIGLEEEKEILWDMPEDEDEPAKPGVMSRLLDKVLFRPKDQDVVEGLDVHMDIEEEERKERELLEQEWPVDNIESLPSLRRFFNLSHISEGNRLVRGDSKRMLVFESEGKEYTEANVAGFAGALNSLQCPVQFLIRQHPPRLNDFRIQMRSERAEKLSDLLVEAADDLDSLLASIEERPGTMDRRFYIICDEDDMRDVAAAMSRVGLRAGYLVDDALRNLVLSINYGLSPDDLKTSGRIHLRENAGVVKCDNGIYRKTIWIKKFPRIMTAGFIQSILTLGIPLDFSVTVRPIPADQAISNLQSQLTTIQSNANRQYRNTGQTGGAEQIALQDILFLRDAVMRGSERLFNASVAITISGDDEDKLQENVTSLRSIFTAVFAEIDELGFYQREGMRTTAPLCSNDVSQWVRLDTSTLALMFPFSPRDLDTRRGTYVGNDVRARSIVTFDVFNAPGAPNMNMAILATSGAGKSFGAKLLGALRPVTRGVMVYIIDPEGEYVDTCRAAGGRVLTPGREGQGMNPFVVTETGEELNERIDNLCILLQVMIGTNLDPTQYAHLNRAMVTYYEKATSGAEIAGNWSGLYQHMKTMAPEIATMVEPFASGSKRFLLSDEGSDMLSEEAPMTVFNLEMLDETMRPAAGMVCAEAVWAMAARDPRYRILLVDEVWQMLKSGIGGSFMMNTAKRARKHHLGLISITQDVQDLLAVNSSEGVAGNSGRALIQNASWKLLLRQDAASIDMIMDTFDLPREEAEQLPSYPTGRSLLISPDGYFTVDIEASRVEEAIIDWRPGRH